MKKMNSQYDKLNDMMENIKGIILDLEGNRDYIKYNAWGKGISMTDREQERCDEIDEQISNLEECVKYLENAKSYLEDYVD